MSKNFVKSYSNEKDIEKVKPFITQTNDLVATKKHNYIQKADETFHCLTDDIKEIKANSEYIQFEKDENTVNVNTEKLDKLLEYPKFFSSTQEFNENNIMKSVDNMIFEKDVFTLPVESNFYIGKFNIKFKVDNSKTSMPFTGASGSVLVGDFLSVDPARIDEYDVMLFSKNEEFFVDSINKVNIIYGLICKKIDNTIVHRMYVNLDTTSEFFDEWDFIVESFDFSLMRFK